MIVVTHEMEFARIVGSRLIFIDCGKIAHDGPPPNCYPIRPASG